MKWEGVLMAIGILSVTARSPADLAGIVSGELLKSINGEPVIDEIDYQAMTAASRLTLDIIGLDSQERQVYIYKPAWEPLGLCLDETVAMKPRHCRNHCLFCFIDQLPQGMRETMYVKDDDWRLSMMMGNYVTLTNVDENEFQRILRRKASPLYISVHSTNPDVRIRLLRNPHAGNILDRLKRLRDHGIQFHGQIVLCPGINDGEILKKTIEDFSSLFPSALSLAIVPIGLTRHREGLVPMRSVTREEAEDVIRTAAIYQQRFLSQFGTRLVFPSDEFFCISGMPLPPESYYEDYPQIENGVGMLRRLEADCVSAYEELSLSGELLPVHPGEKLIIPTGVSVAPFMRMLAGRYAPSGTSVEVVPVSNRFFGETITVTGLIVGKDLTDALKDRQFDRVLISETMLREHTDRFLDNMTLAEVQAILGKPITVVSGSGEAFIRALHGLEVSV